jgi:transcriptional regulator with XRE-family HTH domain
MADDRERYQRRVFGRALRRLRLELGDISQSEMSRRLKGAGYPAEMGPQTVGNWERGDSKPHNPKHLGEYLVLAFNISREQRHYLAQALVFPEDYEEEEPAIFQTR